MAVVDLKGVHRVTVKGHVYIYAWRGPKAPRLYAEPGTAAFVAELADAQATRKTGDPSRLSGLCARYKASDDWTNLAAKTRTSWKPWLDRIQIEFGNLHLAQFDRPWIKKEIRDWRDKFKATPRSADMALQVFSRLMKFAVDEGKLSLNIVTQIPRIYRNDRSDVIWTDDDLTELEKHASPEIMRAARLAIYTGLRQADVLRLSWAHVSQNAVEVRTAKTGATALIPMHGALRALLAGIPKLSPVILTSSDGVPWKTGFGSSWQKAIQKAKIDKHFHDLRGTAATKLYLADLSIREIAGIMAWSENQVEGIINRYVKRDELLKDRIRRMDEAEARTKAVKPGVKPGSTEG